MGVSGSGKSTIGEMLAKELDCVFLEGDDFHSEVNISKIKSGSPLTDDDRSDWLSTLHKQAIQYLKKGDLVISCSALKEEYRKILQADISDHCKWIYLKGDYETISGRIQERKGHFMPSELLQSQFDTLEEPDYGTQIDIKSSPEEIVDHILKKDIGLIGLGVMGKSLALNMAGEGYSLALFNRPEPGIGDQIASDFIDHNPDLANATGFEEIIPFVAALKRPRIIFIMIKAGEAVDQLLDSLKPILNEGDVIIEGGNTHFSDTIRRCESFSQKGIYYLGTGISGGEEGALKGPAIMAGGSAEGFGKAKDIFKSIAAKDKIGNACAGLIGAGGAGHFVKMVHNGIEYGEMQLIAEMYAILKDGYKMNPNQIADTFEQWIKNGSKSYLLEITIAILRKKEGDQWALGKIKDEASSKGTGSWTVQTASDLGVAVPTIAAALFARFQSSDKQQRLAAGKLYRVEKNPIGQSLDNLQKAFQVARIINHHQGFQLIELASKKHHWEIDLASLAQIWTGGCIIQSDLMIELAEILKRNKDILSSAEIVTQVTSSLPHLAMFVSLSARSGMATAAFSASLNYFYNYTNGHSSANLIQAQRDYFGAHGIQWEDDPEGKSFHYNWHE